MALGAAANETGQFVFFIESGDLAGGVDGVIPEPGGVAVGVKDEGALAVHGFEAVSVEFGLLFTDGGVGGGFFGFDDGEGFAVVAPENVVGVANPFGIGHAGNFIFPVAFLVEGPSGALQVEVDEIVAGFGFGVVVGVGLLFVGGSNFGELLLEGLEFGVELVAFLLLFEGVFVLFC